MPWHFTPYLSNDSRISSYGQTPTFSSQWNKCHASHNLAIFKACIRVHSACSIHNYRKSIARWVPDLEGALLLRGANQGWGACQENRLPRAFKISPSSSAAHWQCRAWAVTHTVLLHHYLLAFFYLVSLSSTVLFIFQSDHLHCTQPAPSNASERIYYDSQKLDSF